MIEIGDQVIVDCAKDLGIFLVSDIEYFEGHPVATVIPNDFPDTKRMPRKYGVEFLSRVLN